MNPLEESSLSKADNSESQAALTSQNERQKKDRAMSKEREDFEDWVAKVMPNEPADVKLVAECSWTACAMRKDDHYQTLLDAKDAEIADYKAAVTRNIIKVSALIMKNTTLKALLEQAREAKDSAYHERNQVVAALAKLFPSGIARTNIEGWDDAWHGAVYIQLPTGQISYHYHDSEHHLFSALPPFAGEWDGHTKDDVHNRLQTLAAINAATGEK